MLLVAVMLASLLWAAPTAWADPASDYQAAVLADSPVSYWRMNDTSGTTAADLRGANPGTINNATLGQPGPMTGDASMRFDGGGGINLGTNPSLRPLGSWTVELWFRASPDDAAQCSNNYPYNGKGTCDLYATHAFGFSVLLGESGTVNAFVCASGQPGGDSSGCSSTGTTNTYADNSWHYIVVVRDTSALSIYVDGSLQSSVATQGGATYYCCEDTATIANDHACDCLPLSGWESEVAFYNYALPEQNIRAHYMKAGLGPSSCPTGGLTLSADSNALLKKLKDKQVTLQSPVDLGLLSVVPYAVISLADARACEQNIAVDALADVSPVIPLEQLTVRQLNPDGSVVHRSFLYSFVGGWLHDSSANWSLAPPHQPFTWNWKTFSVAPAAAVTYNDDSDKDTIVIKDDLATVAGPALTTQLINGYPTVPVYLDATLQPQATLGVALSPKSIRGECASEAASPLLAIGSFETYLILKTGKAVIEAVSGAMPNLGGPEQALSTDDVKYAAALIGKYAMDACAAGANDTALKAAILAGAVVVIAVAGPVVATIATLVGGYTLVRPAFAHAGTARAAVVPPSPSPLTLLPVRRVRIVSARGLVAAPLPRRALAPFARAVQAFPATSRVGKLVVSATRLRAGRWLTAVGARLPDRRPHRVQVVVLGPGYTGLRVITVRHGLAGGQIKLPRRMASGLWAVAIIDDSGLHIRRGGRLTGKADMRLGVFRVGHALQAG